MYNIGHFSVHVSLSLFSASMALETCLILLLYNYVKYKITLYNYVQYETKLYYLSI